jgi:2-aminoadipate transaminase
VSASTDIFISKVTMSENVIKFTRGVPPPESFPNQALAECTAAVIAEFGAVIQQYNPSQGFLPLRQLIAAEHHTQPERVLLGQGSLQLLDLAARLLIQPGDEVYVEAPTYDRTVTILRRAGARVTGFPVNLDGPDPDAIERRLKAGPPPKFAYIISDFQNPSGTVMAEEKRRAITALAEKYHFGIFEDTPYRQLRYSGTELPALHDLLPDQVWRMSSYSKTIAPGLRVGYMVIPEPFAKPMAKMAEDTYINASYINQAIAFDYIRRGWFASNLVVLKQLYRQRLEAALEALETCFAGRATWTHPQGGFFIGVWLNNDGNRISMEKLLPAARAAGLELTDGRGFYPDGSGDNFVRLPFCGLTPEEIRLGVERLDMVVSNLK